MIVTNCYCVDLLKEHRCEDCGVIGIETAIMLNMDKKGPKHNSTERDPKSRRPS
jgi:hypothetical protein